MSNINYNEKVFSTLTKKEKMPEEIENIFMDAMNNLTPGNNPYQSVAASYLLLQGTYLKMTQDEIAGVFSSSKKVIKPGIREIRKNKGTEYVNEITYNFAVDFYKENLSDDFLRKLISKDLKDGKTVFEINKKYWIQKVGKETAMERIVRLYPSDILEERVKNDAANGRKVETIARQVGIPEGTVNWILKN